MFKKIVIENKIQKEIDIDFSIFIKELNEFFSGNNFSLAVIQTLYHMNDSGISMTLTNKIYGDMSNVLIFNDLGVYCLEFKEFSNVIAIKESANITLDTNLKRLYLNDFGIKIEFLNS